MTAGISTPQWTTPSDLCLFAIGVEKAYEGQSKLLSEALAREMLSYQSDEIYGLGFALGPRGNALRFWHSGANGGYQSLFEAYPAVGEGAAVMTDGVGGLGLILEIQRQSRRNMAGRTVAWKRIPSPRSAPKL